MQNNFKITRKNSIQEHLNDPYYGQINFRIVQLLEEHPLLISSLTKEVHEILNEIWESTLFLLEKLPNWFDAIDELFRNKENEEIGNFYCYLLGLWYVYSVFSKENNVAPQIISIQDRLEILTQNTFKSILLKQIIGDDEESNSDKLDFLNGFKHFILQSVGTNRIFDKDCYNGEEILTLINNQIELIKSAEETNEKVKETKEKAKETEETPKTFDELFYNTDFVIPCIDILKELEPPLIDTDYNYIGKLKGVFCVWIDEMQRQGIIKSNYPDERKLFALLLEQKIKRFSIDESMFGKHHNKAELLYRTDIKTKVSKIKLSQNSQKGKQGNLSL